MRRLSLVLMVLVGCGDEVTEDEEKAIVKPDTGPENKDRLGERRARDGYDHGWFV